MKKYKTFDEMYNDDDFVTVEERKQISYDVELIGKMVESRKDGDEFD
jgi:hypothetical protein